MDASEGLTDTQKYEREALNHAWDYVFATHQGKRVLFDILELCGVYQTAFSGENTNATSFMLGQQEAGKRVISRLDQVDPRFYAQLLLARAEMKITDEALAIQRSQNLENDNDVDA